MRAMRCGRLGFAAVMGLLCTAGSLAVAPGPSTTAAAAAGPTVDEVEVVDTAPTILRVTGTLFGEKGRARVGGRKARVQSWTDSAVELRVPKGLRGGAHAIELLPRTGLVPPGPFPYVLDAPVPAGSDMKVRVGSKRSRYRNGELTPDPATARIEHWSKHTRKVWSWDTVEEDCERYWVGNIFGGHWAKRCKTRRVRVLEKRRDREFVTLNVPPECVEPGFVGLLTAADVLTEPAPITQWKRRHVKAAVYRTQWSRHVDAQSPDWWMVIACDDDGVVTGQFVGRVAGRKKKQIRGSFVVHPTEE